MSPYTPHLERLKKRQQMKRKPGPTISKERRLETARERKKRDEALQVEIEQEWKRQDLVAMSLATKYRMKLPWMRSQLQRSPYLKYTQRAVNGWNALVHVKSLEINENLPLGEKQHLQDLQSLAKKAVSCGDIPREKLEEMKKCLEETRNYKAKGLKKQSVTRARIITQTINIIKDALLKLDTTCQMASFFVTARTSSKHSISPDYYVHDNTVELIERALGMSIEDFCVKFDAYSILGLRGLGKNDSQRRTEAKSEIRKLIAAGLCKVTNNSQVKMHWKKYEELIVNQHGVVLEGWPNDVFDPNDLGLKDLQVIQAALVTGKCYWRKLTGEERESWERNYIERLANNEVVRRKRKKRSDAGRKRTKRRRVDEDVDVNPDLENEDDDDDA